MMNTTLDINEIKKDLYKSKAMARLMYYEPENGKLMYVVNVLGKDYTFPINTVSRKTMNDKTSIDNRVLFEVHYETLVLSNDLKGTRFEPEIKGSSLIRWITEAIYNNEFH